jgi:SAM-dependent methyltransferase
MSQSLSANNTFPKRCQEIHTSHNHDEEAFKHSRLALSIKTAVQLLYLQAMRWASERISQDLFDGEGKRALDVGSAYGYAASMLHSLRYHAVALDISKYALRTGDKGNRILGDAHNLPIKSDSVNIITCFDTLEHLSKPIQLLRSSYRCLCEGGVLLIENPVANPIDVVSDKVHKMSEIHCSLLNASELANLVLAAGFHTAKKGLLPIPFQRFPLFGRFIEIRVPLSAARRILIAATKD